MTRLFFCLTALALAFLPGCSTESASAPDVRQWDSFETRLDSLIPARLHEYEVPGLAAGVVEGGRVMFAKGYGLADRTTDRPVTARTLFNFASASKPVTAWGVLHLADAGLISLDDPVDAYLRRWHLPESEFETDGVTVRRLLSHTAGISVPAVPWFPADTTLPSLEQVLQGEAGERGPVVVEREPGSRWDYSGGGYAILQLLIEDVTGETFEAYMQKAIFEPLGMQSTTFAPATVSGAGVATPYGEDDEPITPYRLVGAAAGGLYSTVEDFARFLTAYVASRDAIIKQALFETMTTPVAPVELDGADLDGAEYGLGHGVYRTRSGEKIAYHSGGNPGYLAYFLVAPERGHGLVLVSNGSNAVPIIKEVLQLWGKHYELELPPIY